MTAKLLVLEPFDDGASDLAQAIDPSNLPGYQAGFAAGQAASEDLHAKLNETVAEKFTEMAFGYGEAHSHILTSFHSLVDALMNKILPSTIDAISKAHLIALIDEAAANDAQNPITIFANPSEIEGIQSSLPTALSMPISFEADKSLQLSQIIVRSLTAETSLDATAFTEDLQSVLLSCHQMEDGNIKHG